MNADLLRRAATLIRERAHEARGGEWTTFRSRLNPDACLIVSDQGRAAATRIGTCSGSDVEVNKANAEHIAGMSPAVALAVADWLEAEAEMHSHSITGTAVAIGDLPGMDNTPAMRLARAYLGDAS